MQKHRFYRCNRYIATTGLRRHSTVVSRSSSTAPCVATFKSILPVFPVQPLGVFLPGMTKTLHLFEDKFKAMLENTLSDPQQLFVTAVLEPYTGDHNAEDSTPLSPQTSGSLVGGHNFHLSCGCICKVVSSKPYPAGGGFLVRVLGEARVGLAGLEQVEPFMQARVFPMPDAPLRQQDLEQLKTQLELLRSIMKDVQLLASKFRCDETASIQQAMRWVHQPGLLPSIMVLPTLQPPPNTFPSTTEASSPHLEQLPLGPNLNEKPLLSILEDSSAEVTQSIRAGDDGLPGDQVLCSICDPQGVENTEHPNRLLSNYNLQPSDATEMNRMQEAGGLGSLSLNTQSGLLQGDSIHGQFEEEEEDEALLIEEAARLSFAALQWLPQSSHEVGV
ncbi:hypothetical protein CEUSTIGMA_g12121.t1 [Chlamydomonas eustigma]|uniref:Lon N-terminal domain-containing protein n=1 Tax=Chlamydomonas eustigma TaxID=1157962 RepID=A0A250XP31_9CHLO|nr:hypothetical protein CEUSTIGMA_g12121.t1 [Chlamydomonas eustigma]|eukprot:GAX84699.1 hypothetical protein CEUSTIGMA_g12121.t1 [Chlamydomonas eustigma]